MPSPAEYEPIEEDELLYRRVPVSKGWISSGSVKPEAFQPLPIDETGLSVFRAKFLSVEEASRGKSKHGYWVLELRAADLQAAGIDIVPKPVPDVPGHAELPSLRFQDVETDASISQRLTLAKELIAKIHGPFGISSVE